MTVYNFFVKHGPSSQQLKFFGAGLAATVSGFIPQGGKEISLGRYFWMGRDAPPDFTLFYDKTIIDKAHEAPKWTWFKGQLWDLAHKVLAATTFYLTSDHSSLRSIATLLPSRLKTTTVARALLQAAESPRINGSLLFTLHIIDLAPIIIKIANMGLDAARLSAKRADPRLEYLEEKTRQIGKWAESLWYARLALVACGAAGGVSMVLGFLAYNVFNSFLKHQPFLFDTPWKKIRDLAFAGAVGISASFRSALAPPPSRLHELVSLVNRFNLISWQVPDSLTTFLVALKNNTLAPEEKQHVYSRLQDLLERPLNSQVYKYIFDGDLAFLDERESDLRKIFGAGGIVEQVCENRHQLRLEQARFSIMLLCANLMRLKKAVDDKELTMDQCKTVQGFLYLQTLDSIFGEIKPEHLLCCDISKHIESNYINWKELKVWHKPLKECITGDSFFTPLIQILPKVPDCGNDGWNGLLQLFFISLAMSIGVSTDAVPAIKKGPPGNDRSEHPPLSIQVYKATSNMRSMKLSEIIVLAKAAQ